MRVYEFAREKDLSSKDVIALLERGGFQVASHMSVLSDKEQEYLLKNVGAPAAKKTSAAKPAPKNELVKKSPEKKKTLKTPSQPASEERKPAPQVSTANQSYSRPASSSSSTSSYSGPARRHGGRRSSGKRKPKSYYKNKKARQAHKQIPKEVTEITLTKEMPLHEVASLLGKSSGEIILALLKQGQMCNRNQVLSLETIEKLGRAFGIAVHAPVAPAKEEAFDVGTSKDLVSRWPMVVVMGHVDHGKTTLLDYVRKKNVAAKEKGGITQYLGAYEVDSTHGKIVFLDTPGHKAFSYMRKRGARVTDIAVLVVAADDGIKPQTVEAIKHAQHVEIPIIVAINKIDKIENRVTAVESVKRQLSEHDLLSEDWGGDTICVPVSAKTGEGIDQLLEMIVLQAEMSELKANPQVPAQAFVLESKLQKGYGPVATAICLEGTLKQGDYFVCGSSTGKVRLLLNSQGERVKQASPSVPVQVVGFDKFVSLGDWLKVVPLSEYSKAKSSSSYASQVSAQAPAPSDAQSTDEHTSIKIILKTDMQGSMQAVIDSLPQIASKHKDIPASFQVISSGIGDVTENDVAFAADTGAQIFTLHVKAERNSLSLAREKKVEIHTFQIIYKLLEHLEDQFIKQRKAKMVSKKVGEAVVRKVFDVKNLGVIAGCYVKEGLFNRKCKVVCMRNGVNVGEGEIKSLQRERKTVKEVHSGFECGFIADGFDGWQENDIVHAYLEVEEKPENAVS